MGFLKEFFIIFFFFIWTTRFVQTTPIDSINLNRVTDRCNGQACHPYPGDLLIGRKELLSATSTHENNEIRNIVSEIIFKEPYPETFAGLMEIYNSRQRTRWQSEPGVQEVSIQLDLEARMYLTDIAIEFISTPPKAMFLEKSLDFGKTWKPFKYFAANCSESFPDIQTMPIDEECKKTPDAICDSQGLTFDPQYPSFGLLITRIGILPGWVIPELAHFYSVNGLGINTATNLRIRFTELHPLNERYKKLNRTDKHSYQIERMTVTGSCFCYGHSAKCTDFKDEQNIYLSKVGPYCQCEHNTKGKHCEQCDDDKYDLPWKPACGDDVELCKNVTNDVKY